MANERIKNHLREIRIRTPRRQREQAMAFVARVARLVEQRRAAPTGQENDDG